MYKQPLLSCSHPMSPFGASLWLGDLTNSLEPPQQEQDLGQHPAPPLCPPPAPHFGESCSLTEAPPPSPRCQATPAPAFWRVGGWAGSQPRPPTHICCIFIALYHIANYSTKTQRGGAAAAAEPRAAHSHRVRAARKRHHRSVPAGWKPYAVPAGRCVRDAPPAVSAGTPRPASAAEKGEKSVLSAARPGARGPFLGTCRTAVASCVNLVGGLGSV